MSIYCSTWGLGDECKPRCKRMTKDGPKSYIFDDSKPCTCGQTPIKYQGSHVVPSKKDERGGCFGFSLIPEHITRNGKDNGKRKPPFLRFHMNQETVILTREHIAEMNELLTWWLAETKSPNAPNDPMRSV